MQPRTEPQELHLAMAPGPQQQPQPPSRALGQVVLQAAAAVDLSWQVILSGLRQEAMAQGRLQEQPRPRLAPGGGGSQVGEVTWRTIRCSSLHPPLILHLARNPWRKPIQKVIWIIFFSVFFQNARLHLRWQACATLKYSVFKNLILQDYKILMKKHRSIEIIYFTIYTLRAG